MDTSISKIKDILGELKHYHDFELSQIDKHIQTSQYTILLASIFLGTGLLTIAPISVLQKIMQILSIVLLSLAIIISFPYSLKKYSRYKVSPKTDRMLSLYLSDKDDYKTYLKWLIRSYRKAIFENRTKNENCHIRLKLSIYFVLGGGLILVILSIWNVLVYKPN